MWTQQGWGAQGKTSPRPAPGVLQCGPACSWLFHSGTLRKGSEMKHLVFRRLVHGSATKTPGMWEVVLPNTFCVTLALLHLSGVDSSRGPTGARHVFRFDGTREPNAGSGRFWPLPSAIPAGETQHLHGGNRVGCAARCPHGRSHTAGPQPVAFSAQTTQLRCRGARPALEPPHVAVPRSEVTSWRCRRAGPPPAGSPARDRGRSTGSPREGAGPRPPGALTRSMKVRNFQLPP